MELLNKAINYATIKHDGQIRKGNKTPYILPNITVKPLGLAMGI